MNRIADEIRDLNISFLMLAQKAIRTDKPQALYRFGISEHVADLISQMSPQQLVRVASRNQSVCALRFDDELIWCLLSDTHAPSDQVAANADLLHASVLMAGRRAVAA